MSKEQIDSPSVIPTQSNKKITSSMTMHDSSSFINTKLDGTNYSIWFEILEIHIVGREKNVTLLEEKLPQKRIMQFMIDGKMKTF